MSSRTSSKAQPPPSLSAMSTSTSLKPKQKTASSSLASSPSSSSIVALPSMSSHLFILPQARHMESLPVYPTSSAQRYAESEAKLKKALERNAAREDLTGVVTGTSAMEIIVFFSPTTTTAAGATPVPTPPSLQPQPQSPIPSLVGQGHYQQPPYPPRTLVPHPVYSEPSSPISHSPPIMMRSRQKPTY